MSAADELGIPSLEAHGNLHHGPRYRAWWAEAGRPIYDDTEKAKIVRAHGVNPDLQKIHPAHLVTPLEGGRYRTWWYTTPL